MKALFLFLLLLTGIPSLVRADYIAADFRTTGGDFTILLDYLNSPMAVANFIQLAGKDDDILETALGVQDIGTFGHDRQLYRPTANSDVQRLPLRVVFIPETPEFRAHYGIYQNQTLVGGVERFPSRGFHRDITGEDRIRLEALRFDPTQYRITLRYPRPWLDARDLRVKPAPMYRALKVQRIEQGRRFFAGTMTNNRFEHPGYHFQDEVARNPGNLSNPYGTPFNSPGVLAMDSLGPNRNGSGFFITSETEPSWNGRYTAIGSVLNFQDLQVVRQITGAPVDSEGNPIDDLYILDITIRRSGLTANAFMEGFEQNFLPGNIAPLPLTIEHSDDQLSLVSALLPQSQNALYASPDLINFTGGVIESQSPEVTVRPQLDLTPISNAFPRYFFKGFATALPSWPSAELDLENQRLFFAVQSGIDRGTMNLYFGNATPNPGTGLIEMTGTFSIDMVVEQTSGGSGSVMVPARGAGSFAATYDSSRGPFEGRLRFSNVTGPLNVGQITLHFDSGRLFHNPQADPSLLIRRFDAVTTDPERPLLNYGGVFRVL